MPSLSFLCYLHTSVIFFSFFVAPSVGWITGQCTGGFGPADVLRFELNSNIWSSNNSLVAQRGVFLWVGDQGSDTSNNAQQQPFPILTVLSTFYNQTYISTSSSGSQDAPCPDSYTYNSNSGPDANWDDCCTFNSSYTCKGYYDLTTSTPIYLETSSNYTGSPEDVEASSEVQDADVKYGITYTSLVLPSTYGAQTTTGTGTSISHYGLGDQLLGFVNNHQDQILGLGLNSTFINFLYAGGFIASRSLGLYYGVPAAAGPDLERNGSMVLSGYSTSRLQGNFSKNTYPIGKWTLPRHCPWEVDVASVSIGSQTSSSKFTACVEPSELSLVLPSALASQFSSASNSSDLTITLTNGLAATIPSSLVSIRAASDQDQSPILGAPFLSQVYLFIDYQEKTLSTGLANNTLRILPTADQLQCVEHTNTTGALGWAVGSPTDLAEASASSTASASGSKNTGKTSAAPGRSTAGWDVSIFALGLGLALLWS